MKLCFLILFISSLLFPQGLDFNNKFMLAENFEQSGEFQKAKDLYQELYNENPDNFIVFDALNRVLIQLKNYESSIALLEDKLKISPEDINLIGLLGKSYYLAGDENKAFEVWESAFKKPFINETAFRIIANYAIERRAFDKAIEYLEEGKKKSADKFIFSYDLANIYALTMQFTEAAEEYCYILSINPNQLPNVESRIFSYVNKPEALNKTIEVFKTCGKNDDINTKYLLAKLYVEKQSYEDAYNVYLDIDRRLKNEGVELYNFAQVLFNEGEFNFAAKTYQKIIENYPNSPLISSAKLGYAKTMEEDLRKNYAEKLPVWKPYYQPEPLNSESTENIISAYKEIASLYPDSDVRDETYYRIGLIKYQFEDNPDEAEEFFKLISEKNTPSKFSGLANYQLGKISLEKGDFESAINYFSKTASNRSNSEDIKNSARYMIARINFYNKNFEKATEILKEILKNLKDNNANDALELSLILNTKINDSLNVVKFAEAELLTEQKKFKEAAILYKEISDSKKSFLLRYLCQLREAQMETALNNYETSVDILSMIAGESESNIYSDKALYLLGKIYQFGLNNLKKAVETYETLLAKFPNSLYLDEAREEIIKLRNKLS